MDREAVKTLAVAVGVREAARQMNLPEATVQAWSARDEWFATPVKPPTMERATDATKPSVAMANMLAEDSLRTKIGFSRAAVKVADKLGESTPDALMERETAQSAGVWTGIASKVHSWDAKSGPDGVNVMVNVAILGA